MSSSRFGFRSAQLWLAFDGPMDLPDPATAKRMPRYCPSLGGWLATESLRPALPKPVIRRLGEIARLRDIPRLAPSERRRQQPVRGGRAGGGPHLSFVVALGANSPEPSLEGPPLSSSEQGLAIPSTQSTC